MAMLIPPLVLAAWVTGADASLLVASEQVPPIPLPYQAVVVRQSLRNLGNDTHEVLPINHTCNFNGLKTPGSGEFERFRGATLGAGSHLYLNHLGDKGERLKLPPGNEVTASYVFCGDWRSEGELSRAYFSEPGTYEIQFKWAVPIIQRGDFIADPVRVDVLVPEGDDVTVRDRLKEDKPLATAILSPIWSPPDDVADRLKQLVKDFPDSSYVPYARFALARWLATENGSFTPDDLALNLAQAALAQLKRIDPTSFAYGPDALSLRRRIMKGLGYREQHDVAAELDWLFPDSLVRLDDLAMRLTREEWARLDPRKPTRIKEPAVPPAEIEP